MPRGHKPTAHHNKTLPASALMEFLGLRRERTSRNVHKTLKRGKLTYSVDREAFIGRARHRKHVLGKRRRRR